MRSPNSPLGAHADAQLVTELILAVFRLNGALLQWGDSLVEPLGLTSARWQMLGAIALADTPLSAPQIGQAMGVSRQGAQKQLHWLVDQQLLAIGPNPAHSRSPLYTLTAIGRQTYQQADALWRQQAAALGARIPEAQARDTKNALEGMLHGLTSADSANGAEGSP